MYNRRTAQDLPKVNRLLGMVRARLLERQLATPTCCSLSGVIKKLRPVCPPLFSSFFRSNRLNRGVLPRLRRCRSFSFASSHRTRAWRQPYWNR